MNGLILLHIMLEHVLKFIIKDLLLRVLNFFIFLLHDLKLDVKQKILKSATTFT